MKHMPSAATFLALIFLGLLAPMAVFGQAPSFGGESLTKPYLRFEPGDQLHHAELDLSSVRKPILTLTNLDPERSLPVQVLALRGDGGEPRNLVMELEAGATFDVTLHGKGVFEKLLLVAKGPFRGEVAGADGGRTALASRRASKPSVALPGSEPGFTKTVEEPPPVLHCYGDWKLTCTSPEDCDYEVTDDGIVLMRWYGQVGSVSWRLHEPAGDYYTIGDQGCWGQWDHHAMGYGRHCPYAVTNCWGQRYHVTGTIWIP